MSNNSFSSHLANVPSSLINIDLPKAYPVRPNAEYCFMVGNPSTSGISMISVRGQHKELNTARPIDER
jgi:hypothetical protein